MTRRALWRLIGIGLVAGVSGAVAALPPLPPVPAFAGAAGRTSAGADADSETRANPIAGAIEAIGMTVSDLDAARRFYCEVLDFQEMGPAQEAWGETVERLYGVFGVRVRCQRLRLGTEQIELTEFLAPAGRPIPLDSRSNDHWFQHIAIIVSDMDTAYRRLRSHRVRHASSGPQRLPETIPAAAGIEAFYFRDPDGHYLEILQFPAGKGAARWQSKDALFLGIDHTAIVVNDTEASLGFYRDVLGMQVAGHSENFGVEQEHLNNVFGARLRITSLHAVNGGGPAIELLEYLAPRDGRPRPGDWRANDLAFWQIIVRTGGTVDAAAKVLESATTPARRYGVVDLDSAGGAAESQRAVLAADPDGHALRFFERKGATEHGQAKTRRGS